ncbi:MAG: hypothetical protein M0P31_05585 [Solirubrobacteraceae bacterium]|nr:hypothetical protein [Solirubrobacteraceae bacterium]
MARRRPRPPFSAPLLLAPVLGVVLALLAAVPGRAADWSTGIRPTWQTTAVGGQVRSMADPNLVVGVSSDWTGVVVTAVHGETGRIAWRTAVPRVPRLLNQGPYALATGPGIVAIAGYEDVVAIDAHDGRLLWRVDGDIPALGTGRAAAAHVTADAVYYAAPLDHWSAMVMRLDRDDGAERWRRVSGRTLQSTGDRLVVGRSCGFDVLDVMTGDVVWSRPTPTGCANGPRPTVARDGVVADDHGPRLALRRAEDGATVATTDVAVGTVQDARDGLWLARGADAYSLIDADATVRWQRPVESNPVSMTVRIVDGGVLETRHDTSGWVTGPWHASTILIRDLDDGDELATFSPGTGTPPVLDGDGVTAVRHAGVTALEAGPAGAWIGQRIQPGETVADGPRRTPMPTSSRTAELPVAAPEGRATTCRVDDGPWVPCSGQWTTPDLDEGEHVIQVRGEDRPPASWVIAVDRTAPTATITEQPDRVLNRDDGDAIVRMTADEPSARFDCRLDGGDWSSCGPFRATERETGTHRVEVRATDPAGNTGPAVSATWTEDRERPELELDVPPRRIDGYEHDVTFTATDGQGPVRSRCAISGGDLDTPVTDEDCASPWRVAVPGPGFYDVEVVTADAAGNEVRRTTDLAFLARRDLVPEFTATPGAQGGPYWGRSLSVRGGFKAIAGFHVKLDCRFGDDAEWYLGCGSTGFSPGVRGMADRDGHHELQVRARDDMDRTGPVARHRFGIDREAPVARLAGGDTGPVRIGDRVTLPTMHVEPTGPDESPLVQAECRVQINTRDAPAVACGDTIDMPEGYGVWVGIVVRDEVGNETRASRLIKPGEPDEGPGGPDGGDPDPAPEVTDPAPAPGVAGPGGAERDLLEWWAGLVAAGAAQGGAGDGGAARDADPPATSKADRPRERCAVARRHGRHVPVVRSVARRGKRLVLRVRVPRAKRGRPVRVRIQTRAACGRWRAVGKVVRARSTTVRVRTARLARTIDEVRVQRLSPGGRATSAGRRVR